MACGHLFLTTELVLLRELALVSLVMLPFPLIFASGLRPSFSLTAKVVLLRELALTSLVILSLPPCFAWWPAHVRPMNIE